MPAILPTAACVERVDRDSARRLGVGYAALNRRVMPSSVMIAWLAPPQVLGCVNG